MQKFVDQTISANTNYDPERYRDGKVPMSVILNDILLAYRWGIKTLYYHNTRDHSKDNHFEDGEVIEEEDDGGCDGGGCKI